MDTSTFNYGVGAFVAFGGLMGFLKKKSLPSLVAGGGSGLVYALAAYRIQGEHPDGTYIALGISLLLSAVMAKRALNAKKFMPAGLVATAAAVALLVNGISLRNE
eukprot:m.21228 g.21228  ORF g.21228 m.21228 type:complete len:105 (+) comp8696_c0_seq1:171-485(+)